MIFFYFNLLQIINYSIKVNCVFMIILSIKICLMLFKNILINNYRNLNYYNPKIINLYKKLLCLNNFKIIIINN